MYGEKRFLLCRHCGKMVRVVDDKGPPLMCCGEAMADVVPNTEGAGAEKHLPVVTIVGDKVSVQIGSVLHPMEDGHHIAFVYIGTKQGLQIKSLKLGEEPVLSFSLVDDQPTAAYAYCNLHGLWMTEIK